MDADVATSDLQVHGAVRDVVTDPTGAGRIVGEATLDCVVAPDRNVTAVTSDPSDARLHALVGRPARSGWRAAARAVLDEDHILGTLLDDVPIAVLLSSYGALRHGTIDLPSVQPLMRNMRNLCAGWADSATPMRLIDAGARMPLPGVVPVPADDQGDPLGREPRMPMVPGEVRRSRRLDVVPGAAVEVLASFRDTWCDAAGDEGVLHEYALTARLDGDHRIASIDADPRVLPYGECSLAAVSPRRLVGTAIGDVADVVKATAGTTTCTHLDDLLRSLVGVPALLRRYGDW